MTSITDNKKFIEHMTDFYEGKQKIRVIKEAKKELARLKNKADLSDKDKKTLAELQKMEKPDDVISELKTNKTKAYYLAIMSCTEKYFELKEILDGKEEEPSEEESNELAEYFDWLRWASFAIRARVVKWKEKDRKTESDDDIREKLKSLDGVLKKALSFSQSEQEKIHESFRLIKRAKSVFLSGGNLTDTKRAVLLSSVEHFVRYLCLLEKKRFYRGPFGDENADCKYNWNNFSSLATQVPLWIDKVKENISSEELKSQELLRNCQRLKTDFSKYWKGYCQIKQNDKDLFTEVDKKISACVEEEIILRYGNVLEKGLLKLRRKVKELAKDLSKYNEWFYQLGQSIKSLGKIPFDIADFVGEPGSRITSFYQLWKERKVENTLILGMGVLAGILCVSVALPGLPIGAAAVTLKGASILIAGTLTPIFGKMRWDASKKALIETNKKEQKALEGKIKEKTEEIDENKKRTLALYTEKSIKNREDVIDKKGYHDLSLDVERRRAEETRQRDALLEQQLSSLMELHRDNPQGLAEAITELALSSGVASAGMQNRLSELREQLDVQRQDEMTARRNVLNARRGFFNIPAGSRLRRWYKFSEVNKLFSAEVKSYGNVFCLEKTACRMSTRAKDLTAPKVERWLADVKEQQPEAGQTVILSIDLGNYSHEIRKPHVAAIYLRFTDALDKPIVGYFDPLAAELPEVIQQGIKKYYPGLNGEEILKSPVSFDREEDFSHASPWVVEIIKTLLATDGESMLSATADTLQFREQQEGDLNALKLEEQRSYPEGLRARF